MQNTRGALVILLFCNTLKNPPIKLSMCLFPGGTVWVCKQTEFVLRTVNNLRTGRHKIVNQFESSYGWDNYTDCSPATETTRRTCAIAGERSRSLDYLWRDNRLPRSLKLRLYAASVCSTLTHGSEAWMLTPRALATLNGFNSRQLHRITGRSYQEEATTPSYDLLMAVRTRRLHWLGHILRMPADRLVRRAVLALGQRDGPPYQPGSILMDTPLPLTELLQRAADRRGWARDGRSLSSPQESP